MTETPQRKVRNVLITGGAGFVGSNLAAYLLSQPETNVTLYDNLSRSGVEHNLHWLKALAPASRLRYICGDVRQFDDLAQAAKGVDEIYHLAAQVAVTTSLDDPRSDFEVNAQGTLNVLEAARLSGRRPMVLFTSTNKVYGQLETVSVHKQGSRYQADDPEFRGATESTPLDFHSPYGCSKGAADQYVRDYARIYDLPTVVFRMSCIAGPRQFGNEDQGWVAHFLYSALSGRPITLYGDGLQVRDVLHVEDLVQAMQSARNHLDITHGQVYNIGGGYDRSSSILEMLARIEQITGSRCLCDHGDVRPGDQPLYISEISKLHTHCGWKPRKTLNDTLNDIYAFWKKNRRLIESRHEASSQARHLVPQEVA